MNIFIYLIFNLIQACRNLTHHFHNSQKSNAVSKLALTLLALSENTNEQLIVHKEFNYTELSKYLGVHHITITRIMSILKKEGVIEKKGHTILIIDKEQLLLYAHNKKTLQY